MLKKAEFDDIVKYGDFVYELTLDQTKSAYPTYADGIKTREDFDDTDSANKIKHAPLRPCIINTGQSKRGRAADV